MTNYVKKEELQEHLRKYITQLNYCKENNLPLPQIPNVIGVAILDIATRLATRPNFNQYTYKDEMISNAIEDCCKGVDLYNPEKFNNPFGYFTQISWFAFLRKIDNEKYENYLKAKNYQQSFVFNGLIENLDREDYDMISSNINSINEASAYVISSWEEKQAEKKQKINDKKKLKEGKPK
jgi:hypothetical protein